MDLNHSYLVDLFYSMYWLLSVLKKVNIAEVFFCWVVTEGGLRKTKAGGEIIKRLLECPYPLAARLLPNKIMLLEVLMQQTPLL